jgi:hypothetical protein
LIQKGTQFITQNVSKLMSTKGGQLISKGLALGGKGLAAGGRVIGGVSRGLSAANNVLTPILAAYQFHQRVE